MENKDVIDILNSVDTKIQAFSIDLKTHLTEIKTDLKELKNKVDDSALNSNNLTVTQKSCMEQLGKDRVKWDEAYKDTTVIRVARKNPKAIGVAVLIVLYMGGPEWFMKIKELFSAISF